MILTDEFAIIFHDWNPSMVFLAPVVAAINIVDNELELATYQGPQFFDHDPAKMAILTAVYSYRIQCRSAPGPATRRSTTGTNLRKNNDRGRLNGIGPARNFKKPCRNVAEQGMGH